MPEARTEPMSRYALLAISVGGAGLGVAVGVGGVLALAILVALGVLALGLLFPAAVASLLLSVPYLYNLGRVELFGTVAVRMLQGMWVIVLLGMLLLASIRRGLPMRGVPRGIVALGLAFLAWQTVSAGVAGTMRSQVEVAQTFYLLALAYVLAALTGARGVDSWLSTGRRAALGFLAVIAASLPGYVAPVLRFPYYVVKVGPGISVTNLTQRVDPASFIAYGIPRYSLMSLGPVATAAVLLVAICFGAAWLMHGVSGRDVIVAQLLVAVSTVLLLLTLSRAAWLIGGIVIIALAMKSNARRLAFAVVILGAVAALLLSVPPFSTRFADITNQSEGSNRSHARLDMTAVYMAAAKPVFGWGPGRYAEIASTLGVGGDTVNITDIDAHNFVLQEAAETGWVGAGLEVVLLASILIWSFRRLRSAPLPQLAVLVAASSILAMGLTMNILRTEVAWTLLGLTLGCATMSEATAAEARREEEALAA